MPLPLFPRLAPFLLLLASAAAEPVATPSAGAKPAENSAELSSAEAAMKKFTVAPGLQVDLWAAEPLLINPVAFSFDHLGRAFVAETGRRKTTVPDIRSLESWETANMALRTVADRLAFLQKQYPPDPTRKATRSLPDRNGDGLFNLNDWAVEGERLKLITDTNGDGRADQASVFAEGFKDVLTGVGAGVLAYGGNVFYTCVPDLWRLSGEKAGAARQREVMLTGFGPHIVFSGHDMHGPKIGPDGKLYWSIGDTGAHVKTKEGAVLDYSDTGAVFRSDLDGKNAEMFAFGLRNPQSLAFNDLGDLFTGDNNADGGDKARWTHVVEGGDYGWRLGWQFLRKNDQQPQLGAWNSEGMWRLDVAKTNLSLLPPVAHIGHGPAGIAYYPGTGLPDSYREHFFLADFPGGIRSFKLAPAGATYRVDQGGDFLQDN
ncbi:MAG TPA: PQQ-dependent sugar dehydrogenase, partial [Chthoniobacteraceae bacterium]